MQLLGDRPLTASERQLRYAKKHPEKVAAKLKAWKEKNPDRLKAHRDKWFSCPEKRMRHTIRMAKRRALKSGREFNISLEDILPLPEVCPILGVKINYSGTGRRGFINDCPSIDRIDSRLGYIKGNVRIICWRANRLKADATADELQKILNYMRGVI